jgi:hypothetical protein
VRTVYTRGIFALFGIHRIQLPSRIREAGEDPDWSILDDRRGDLPEFPIDNLSVSCREWVERAAHGAGATPAHVGVPLLGIASSLIGSSRRVMASRSWTQPMTSWAAVVGFSGTSKTPGIDATRRALSQIERSRMDKIAELKRAHDGRVETAKAARAQWKKDLKRVAEEKIVRLGEYRSKVASEPVMPPEAVDPGPFVAPRPYVSNATIERLAALLQARPQGMLMLSDELAGLFLNMSRYSGGQDNEFWLEAWNGSPYTIERVGRPPISVSHLLIGVVGGLQPDKLARSFRGGPRRHVCKASFCVAGRPALSAADKRSGGGRTRNRQCLDADYRPRMRGRG